MFPNNVLFDKFAILTSYCMQPWAATKVKLPFSCGDSGWEGSDWIWQWPSNKGFCSVFTPIYWLQDRNHCNSRDISHLDTKQCDKMNIGAKNLSNSKLRWNCVMAEFSVGLDYPAWQNDLRRKNNRLNDFELDEWPSDLYSLHQVTEVKLGRVRSDSGWMTSEGHNVTTRSCNVVYFFCFVNSASHQM